MILFVCIHNAFKGVMAGAIFNSLLRRLKAESTDIEPAEELDHIKLKIIRNGGCKIRKTKPVRLEEIKLKDFQLVVTVCDGLRCVTFPILMLRGGKYRSRKESQKRFVRRFLMNWREKSGSS